MATNSNTPTTLGSLEFSEIKKNLTSYLKNQSVFSGYNFEGSALQSVIDLLAYNTFYYAYYANMINAEAFLDSAQKEDSIISLCKPLGYTVPARTSSRASILVSGLSGVNTIASGTVFRVSDSNGTSYNFYTLEDIPVVDGLASAFNVYEGINYISFDALANFDYENQKIAIAATTVDLDTVQVTTTDELGVVQVWSKVGNIGYTSRINENIYFIERTSTGFAILFGSVNSVGKSIDSTIEKLNVRYLTCNGSAPNSLSAFSSPTLNGVVQAVSQSFGGKSNPDLDEVRFIAPKWFAAQERAVTVNDYKALLLQSGYFDSDQQFNVFGGQDLIPPKYGRVFISANLQVGNEGDDEKIRDIMSFLKERSVITIFPEYVITEALNVYTDFFFGLGPNTTNDAKTRTSLLGSIKSLFKANYSVTGKFNVSFSASDFISLLRGNSSTDISNIIISPDNFTNYVRETLVADKEYLFNLGNELYLQPFFPVNITEPFDTELNADGIKSVLRMSVSSNSSKNNKTNLQLYHINQTTGEETFVPGDYGYFIANQGVISINKGLISTTAIMNVVFAKKSFNIKFNNLVTFDYNTVAIV